MATIDLSRSATDLRKHYTSVRAQMGRVFTDDDHNENERLHGEDERRLRVDIIGPSGSPDDGFLIQDPDPGVANGKIDFTIKRGAFYLGGNHLFLDEDERFQQQADWLNMSVADTPDTPDVHRYDLVFLECWLQPVSAVEDRELFEVALGGPDTSVRMRLMRRVRVFGSGTTGDCHQDWASLVTQWTTAGLGTLNEQNELLVDTKLKVSFVGGADTNDLCSPPVSGGYLGAENQAIRVQLVDETHFTWGFDNAATQYRVIIGTDANGTLRKVKMITEPKDQAHWPVAGQIVEILSWSAMLPNQEKISGLSGFLARVATSYDPDTHELFLAEAIPDSQLGEGWLNDFNPDFFYMRVWDRGLDTSSEAKISFTSGLPVPLGNTGLTVTFTGNDQRAMDYWIIAARPESPDRVVPWSLEKGRSPHGYRRYLAPLAVIEWTPGVNGVIGKVIHDCRRRFPTLTQMNSCCTYTVGDGVGSFGMFNNIQNAIDHLPAGGGEICVLPGVYTECLLIQNRTNIIVHGCGSRSLIVAASPLPGASAESAVHVVDSRGIRIESLAIEAHRGGIGVLLSAETLDRHARMPMLRDITLEDLRVTAATRSAIEAHGGQHIIIRCCDIRMADVASSWPGIFLLGDDALIERNQIQVRSSRQTDDGSAWDLPLSAGRGGLQIGGTSERVRIVDNLIQRGIGNGITLGSLQINDETGTKKNPWIGWFINIDDPCSPCFPGDSLMPPPAKGIQIVLPAESAGWLYDITIEHNRILDMGLNGIGVVGFFDLLGQPELITVAGLTIIGNEIHRCLQRPLAPIGAANVDHMGYGGIALGDVFSLTIRENLIEDNGPDHLEPICGVFVLHGEGIDISCNRIVNNGARTKQPAASAKEGRRGGINVVHCTMPTAAASNGLPALKVHDNIVSAPLGQALSASVAGPVSVQGNQFTTHGVVQKANSPITSTVEINNLGKSKDLYGQFLKFKSVVLHQLGLAPGPFLNNGIVFFSVVGPGIQPTGQSLANGKVLFTDNQCVTDLFEAGLSLASSCVRIHTLDDLGFHNNQCDGDLLQDRVIAPTILFGISLRVCGNRFGEGVNNAVFSAMTLGLINMTTDNQATHCLLVRPSPPAKWVVADPNTVLFSGPCQQLDKQLGDAAWILGGLS